MALLTNRLQEILPLFPDAVHARISDVYQKIPGSFFKFLDPALITKKVQCREQDLRVDPSMLTEQHGDGIHTTHVVPSHTQRNGQRPDGYPVNPQVGPRQSNPSAPTYGHPPISEYNKYRNALRAFLLNSIGTAFHRQNITEVPAKAIANEIVQHCFQQVPDWGRYQCQTPSTIVQFNSPFIKEEATQSAHINAYVYAFLKFEYDESLMPWKGDRQPKTSFEITIELNGVAVNLKRLTEMNQLLASNKVPDAIRMIESNSAVQWEDLEHYGLKPAPPTKTTLTWTDL